MRIISRFFSRIFENVDRVHEIHIRHLYKTITGDKIRELDENTLTGRLINYLNNEGASNDSESTNMFVLSTEDIKFQNINVEQVVSTIKKFRVYQNIHGRNTSLNLLNELDDKCSRRVKHLETREILEILLAYMRTIPNRITEYKYYNSAVGELTNRLHMLSKTELINLIFYIGLGKKLVKPQLLRNCINSFKETSIKCLTTEELCIICNATFKASTKIDNKVFLDKVVTHLEDNLSILQDPAFFVTLLKTIRHNRYQTENLLTTISCTIFFNKTHERYSFTALSHISALYSDYLHYDQNLLKLFTTRCISLLKEKEFISTNEYSPDIPRMKDIKRLLWCLSNLNFKNLNLTDIENVIVPNILKRIEAGELKNDSFSLIEIVLYLWMLNYRTYELMPYALSDENISFVKESNSPTRHRLNLLLSCIFYEDRGLFREFNILPDFTTVYDMKYQLEKRPLLPRIMKNLTTIGAWQNVNKFEVSCQVPGLNILGITGYRKKIYKALHIEVLDDYTTMKNIEDMPTGLMELKLRILNCQEEGVILIHCNEVEAMCHQELQQFLLQEMEIVC